MNITRENITPFLDEEIPDGETDRVDAWLTAISAQLNATFGTGLPAATAPAVYDIVANVIDRRRRRGSMGEDPRIRRQNTGPSGVEYNTEVTALSGWFWPGEANTLGILFWGGGTVRSIRTPAPDGIRYGNISRRPLDLDIGMLGIEDDGDEEWLEGDAS